MSDLLIRDVPEDVLAALDQRALELGISRAEYVRRRLAQDAGVARVSLTVDHWHRFAETYSDLADPDVLEQAWG